MTIKDSPCCGKKCFSTFANVPLDTGSCMAFSAELLCAAEWALRGYYCIDEFDLSRIAQEWVPLCIVFLVSIPQKLLHWCHLTVLLAIPRSFPPRFGFLALYHLHHLVRGDALFYYRYGHCANGELFYKSNRKLREEHSSGIWDAAFDIAHRLCVGCQSYGVHDLDVLQMDASSIVGKIKDTMTWDTARDFCSLKPSK